MTQIDDLTNELTKELTLFSEKVADGLKTEAKKSMKELVKVTKATAPVGRRRRHYKDNISSKKRYENKQGAVYVWYVKGADYRLSHLLNNGHALKNGGRYQGTQFITKAHDQVIQEYEQNVEEVINNA